MARYGYHTGQLEIPPYLQRAEIAADCEEGLIPYATRKSEKAYWIVPADQVVEYLKSKTYIPAHIVEKKLIELKLVNQRYAERKPNSNVIQMNLLNANLISQV